MPDDRLFHKRLGHSEKVNSLTDFEDLVWRAYVLSADDFGVMRFSAIPLQADHDRLAKRPQKAVQRALERVRDVGLVTAFQHQGHAYCASCDWQDHQHVKHPRQTINPKPSNDLLATFTPLTAGLFRHWPGKKKEIVPEDSGKSSETFRHLVRAGARETANGLQQEANGERRTANAAAELPERAGAFAEWYAEAHERFIGVAYIGNPQRDYSAALEIVGKLSDQEARDAATVWFGMDDAFATQGTRTIPKFASRASDCLLRARRVSA